MILAGAQGDQSAIAVVGDGDNSSSILRVKSGAYGAMIQAAGSGGGRHCGATGVALDQDRQAQIGSSKAITQTGLRLLSIVELLEMFRFTILQTPLEAQAPLTLGQHQAVQRLGLVEALAHQFLFLFGQLLPQAPALDLPGHCRAQQHQHPAEPKPQAVQHNTSRALPQSSRRSDRPFNPPLICRVIRLNSP